MEPSARGPEVEKVRSNSSNLGAQEILGGHPQSGSLLPTFCQQEEGLSPNLLPSHTSHSSPRPPHATKPPFITSSHLLSRSRPGLGKRHVILEPGGLLNFTHWVQEGSTPSSATL